MNNSYLTMGRANGELNHDIKESLIEMSAG